MEDKRKTIYIIRHGEADSKTNDSVCVGRYPDLGLTVKGEKQAEYLKGCFGSDIQRIYCSPLYRSKKTAEVISNGKLIIQILEGITEISMGSWEGMKFQDIQKEYPKIYNKREKDHSIIPNDGESYFHTAERMKKTLQELLYEQKDSVDEILMVSHSGAIRALLCDLNKIPFSKNRQIPQSNCCVNVLQEENGMIRVIRMGVSPDIVPEKEEIMELWEQYKVPKKVREHMQAVAELALDLWSIIPKGKNCLNRNLIYAGAMLHDLCKRKKNHAKEGEKIIRKLGYIKLAYLIGLHHGGEFLSQLDEAQLVFLADKFILGTKRVSLEERFTKSREKCRLNNEFQMHKQRYQQALVIWEKYKSTILDNAMRTGGDKYVEII